MQDTARWRTTLNTRWREKDSRDVAEEESGVVD